MSLSHPHRPWSCAFAALAVASAAWTWHQSGQAEAPSANALLPGPSLAADTTARHRPAGAGEGVPAAGRVDPASPEQAWDAQAAIRQGQPYADVIQRLRQRHAPGDLQLATQLASFCVDAQQWRLRADASAAQQAAARTAQAHCSSLGDQPHLTLEALRQWRQATPDRWIGWQAAWERGSATDRRQMLAHAGDSRLVMEALLDPRTRWSAGGWSGDPHNRLTLSDSALQWSLCQSQDHCEAGLGPMALQRCVEDGQCATSDLAYWQQAVSQEESRMPPQAQQQARGQREALARVIRLGSWHELDWHAAPATALLKARIED
ncbi:MAG: hypothetical protein E6Q92_02350 [Burkholderiaceae bacterium]|nr:MAG: hypothetical protein E6Q92_02350 [Burkholderiaceae bacterium]